MSHYPPISEDLLIYFIVHCATHLHLKYSTIKVYLAGIRHHYIMAGLPNPVTSINNQPQLRLQYTLWEFNGARTIVTSPATITFDILQQLCLLLHSTVYGPYLDLLLESVFVLAFLACNLCVRDLNVQTDTQGYPDALSVNIKASKTDQMRRGFKLRLFATKSTICPVTTIHRFLRVHRQMCSLPQELLFILPERQVSGNFSVEKREFSGKDAIVQDCNATSPGSRCIVGCPIGQHVESSDCTFGTCCKQPKNDGPCTKFSGKCVEPENCQSPGYTLPWRCTDTYNMVCCIAKPGDRCGEGGNCIVGCPNKNVIAGLCPRATGKCCRPPIDDEVCNIGPGNCVSRKKCSPLPKYSWPWRCAGGDDSVCCYDPEFSGEDAIVQDCNATSPGSRCIVGCPIGQHVESSDCTFGTCCKQPKNDRPCTKFSGKCVKPENCPSPGYTLPWRCPDTYNMVCCIAKPGDRCGEGGNCIVGCPNKNVIDGLCPTATGKCCRPPIDDEVCKNGPGNCVSRKKCSPLPKYSWPWRCADGDDRICCYDPVAHGGGEKDPHMLTFSGVKYNFQGYCSYTLVKDCRSNSPAFDITADFRGRYEPMEPPTRMVAVSATVNGYDTYTFRDDHSVLHNGQLVLERELTIAGGVGHIYVEDDRVALFLNIEGISLEWVAKDHAASVTLGHNELAGKLCGMLGDGTRLKGHDLVKLDGTRTFNTTEFAESWVIPGRWV
ncbi:von Willebrand factor-like [Ptychodera flava]|uniref:von Willebrand factor-like n=1 Tax=Ptychodera flava TaxID=63121 RepID=UPI00396A7B8B